jgi:hypothetical protein
VNSVPVLTLDAKHEALQDTVGMPTNDNWQLLEGAKVKRELIISELNAALLETLAYCKSPEVKTWGMIRTHLQERIFPLAKKYPKAGIFDSEASLTIATFFGVNYSPSIYDFLRYNWASLVVRDTAVGH